MESSAESVLRFKITGEQSIDRMAPLTVEAAATYFQHQIEQVYIHYTLYIYALTNKLTNLTNYRHYFFKFLCSAKCCFYIY